MITETGGGLSVLIVTESDKNWETFSAWYSVYKNLPDARRAIICQRSGEMPFEYYQWAKRLKEPIAWRQKLAFQSETMSVLESLKLAFERGMIDKNILVINHYVMAIDVIDKRILGLMNGEKNWIDGDVWFLKKPDIGRMIEDYALEDIFPSENEQLCVDAKFERLAPLVVYHKGCGRWINTSKGCPFSGAGELATIDMSVNERRILDLWKRMTPLYKALV